MSKEFRAFVIVFLFFILLVSPALSATEYNLKIKSGENPAVISSGSELLATYAREDFSLKVVLLELKSGGSAEVVDSVVLTDTTRKNTAVCLGDILSLAFIDADSYIRLSFIELTRSGELDYIFNKVLTEKSASAPTVAAYGKKVFVAWVVSGGEGNIGLCCLSVSKKGKAKIKIQRTLYDFTTSLPPSITVLDGYLYLAYADNDGAVHIIPFEIEEKGTKIDLIQAEERPLNIKAYTANGGLPSCPPTVETHEGVLYLGWVDYSDEMIHIRSYEPTDGILTIHTEEKIFREKVTHFNMYEHKGNIWVSWIDDYNPGSRTTFTTYTQKVW